MSSASSGICWPNRFFIKWLLCFFAAFAVGAIIAAAIPKPQTKLVSAYVDVYTRAGTSAAQRTPANIYFGKTPTDISRDNILRAPNKRTQESGLLIDFVVFPLDASGKEHDPVHVQVPWPRQPDKIVTITLDLSTHTGDVSVSH